MRSRSTVYLYFYPQFTKTPWVQTGSQRNRGGARVLCRAEVLFVVSLSLSAVLPRWATHCFHLSCSQLTWKLLLAEGTPSGPVCITMLLDFKIYLYVRGTFILTGHDDKLRWLNHQPDNNNRTHFKVYTFNPFQIKVDDLKKLYNVAINYSMC